MTPIPRNLTVYKGITFTFFFILRNDLTVISSFTVDQTTDIFTSSVNHGLSVGDPVQFTVTNGFLPTPILPTTDYFVITVPSLTTFTISSTYGGPILDITSAVSGTGNVWTNRPVDLTGWSVWSWVKVAPGGALVLDLNPQISSTPTTGKIDLSMTDTATAALTPGNFVWDLIMQDPTGARQGPLFSGAFSVFELVTEPAGA